MEKGAGERMDRRLSDLGRAMGNPEWTIESLKEHLEYQVKQLREYFDSRLSERDVRYEHRHEATQRALETGLAMQRSAIETALESQRTAVLKAETAAEKRFEGVNEFRNTLSDQQRTLIPRSEVMVMIEATNGKIGALDKQANDKIDALDKQMDRLLAERAGLKGGWGYAVGVVGFVLTLLSVAYVISQLSNR